MKKLLFPLAAATTLLATPAFAAPTQDHPTRQDHKMPPAARKHRQQAHRADNYGYAKDHKVTPDERKRWEETHRNGQHQDHPGDRH